jgi:uncharacterized protein YuzE
VRRRIAYPWTEYGPSCQRRSLSSRPSWEVKKILYDEATDILTILLGDAPVAESAEGKRGVIVDYDADGNFVAIEVVDASDLLDDPASLVLR